MRIGPHDILEPGTEVRVGAMRGKVVGHTEETARPSGTIIVHEIRTTDRMKSHFGNRVTWEPVERSVIIRPNYSFVTVLEQPKEK